MCVQCLSGGHKLLRMLIQFSCNAPKMGFNPQKIIHSQFILRTLLTSSLSLLYSTIQSSLDAHSILIQCPMHATPILQRPPEMCTYPIILPVFPTPSLPLIHSPIIQPNLLPHYLPLFKGTSAQRCYMGLTILLVLVLLLLLLLILSEMLIMNEHPMSIHCASSTHPPCIHQASTAHLPRIHRASTAHPMCIHRASITHPMCITGESN